MSGPDHLRDGKIYTLKTPNIMAVTWTNPASTILKDLQKVREQALNAGYNVLDPVVVQNILRACEYGDRLSRKSWAKQARRLKKRHKRNRLRKQKQ